MKTHMSPWLLTFANRVAKVPFMKAILKPIYYPYKDRIRANRAKALQRYSVDVLREFDELMNKNNIHYSVIAGTLLGAVREKGPIKHDLDIDTIIWNEEYSPRINSILASNGFVLIRKYEVDGGRLSREETYEKNGVDIDIFYIYGDDKFPTYQCGFKPLADCVTPAESMSRYGYVSVIRHEFPISHELVRLPYSDIMVNAPSNFEQWLSMRYGADYMTPNPAFADKGDNPGIKEWTDVKATYWYLKR